MPSQHTRDSGEILRIWGVCQPCMGSHFPCPHLENLHDLGCQAIKGSPWAEGPTASCKFTSSCQLSTVGIYAILGPSAWVLGLLGDPFLCLSSSVTLSLLWLLSCLARHTTSQPSMPKHAYLV